MDDHATRVALFRYGVIAPLLAPDLEPDERRRIRESVLTQAHAVPGEAKARRISPRTLRRWLRAYRESGFSGLRPKERRDQGRPRTIRPEVLEKAVALREEVPSRSTRQIIDILVTRPGDPRGPRRAQTLDPGQALREAGQDEKPFEKPQGLLPALREGPP